MKSICIFALSRILMPFIYPILGNVCLSDAACHQADHIDKALVKHEILHFTVDMGILCQLKCHVVNECISYNLGPSSVPGKMICQLNDADRHQFPWDFIQKVGYTYFEAENICKENFCGKNEICQSGFGDDKYRCICPIGFTGPHCEIETMSEWVQVNTVPVCIGTKNDDYGTFKASFSGQLQGIKLVHISGGVAWSSGSSYEGNWGDKGSKKFEIHVTDVNNVRLAPPSSYPFQYALPGKNVMDKELVFPEFNPPLAVTKSKVFRAWYQQDLRNYTEQNNSGRVCANVFLKFAKKN